MPLWRDHFLWLFIEFIIHVIKGYRFIEKTTFLKVSSFSNIFDYIFEINIDFGYNIFLISTTRYRKQQASWRPYFDGILFTSTCLGDDRNI